MSSQKIQWRKLFILSWMFFSESLAFNFFNLHLLNFFSLSTLDALAATSLSGCFMLVSGIFEYSLSFLAQYLPRKWSFLTSSVILSTANLLVAGIYKVSLAPSTFVVISIMLFIAMGCALSDMSMYDLLIYNNHEGRLGHIDAIVLRRTLMGLCGGISLLLYQFLNRSSAFFVIACLNLFNTLLHLTQGQEVYPLETSRQKKQYYIIDVLYMVMTVPLALACYLQPDLLLPSTLLFLGSLCWGIVRGHMAQIATILGSILAVFSVVEPKAVLVLYIPILILPVFYLVYYCEKAKITERQKILGGIFFLVQTTISLIFYALTKNIVIWFQLFHFNQRIGSLVATPQVIELVGKMFQFVVNIVGLALVFREETQTYNTMVSYSNIISALSLIYLGILPIIHKPPISSIWMLPFVLAYVLNNFFLMRHSVRAIYYFFPEDIRKSVLGLISILLTAIMGVTSQLPSIYRTLEQGKDIQVFSNALIGWGLGLLLVCWFCLTLPLLKNKKLAK